MDEDSNQPEERHSWERPPEASPPKKRKSLVPGCSMILISPLVFSMGAASLLWEGPHGPNGEITGDPGAPFYFLSLSLLAAGLFVAGIVLIKKARAK